MEGERRLVGLCQYCWEEIYEGDLDIDENKPLHKDCVEKYKRL